MLWIGIDTHLKTHEVEIQNENGKRMWKGRINNERDGFESLLKKIATVEKSNNQKVMGIFMNPTGNYHMPIRHFLESSSFPVYVIDARMTEHLRIVQNLGKERNPIRRMHRFLLQPHALIHQPLIPGDMNECRNPGSPECLNS